MSLLNHSRYVICSSTRPGRSIYSNRKEEVAPQGIMRTSQAVVISEQYRPLLDSDKEDPIIWDNATECVEGRTQAASGCSKSRLVKLSSALPSIHSMLAETANEGASFRLFPYTAASNREPNLGLEAGCLRPLID